MRFFSKAAIATAAAGIAVVGSVAASGGAASAATTPTTTGSPSVGCSTGAVVLEAGVDSTCTADGGQVDYPTGYTVTASADTIEPSVLADLSTLLATDGDAKSGLLTSLRSPLTENVAFKLHCSVNGKTVTKTESYSGLADGQTKTVNLQMAVGSPAPDKCNITDFTVTSPISPSALDATLVSGLTKNEVSTVTGLLGTFPGGKTTLPGLSNADLTSLLSTTVSAHVTADTAVPGAIYTGAGTTSTGLTADVCADDTKDGNSGTAIELYTCNSDLAQLFIQAAKGQLVRNGDCITQTGSDVVLQTCTAGSTSQEWTVNGSGGSFGTIVNKSSGDCLTFPKAVDFTDFTATTCSGAADQNFAAPAASAA